MEWQKTFEFSASLADVWEAYWETDEPQVWNNPIKGDAYISNGVVQSEIVELEPEQVIRWAEAEGHERIEMSLTFESTENGTKLTLTRSGFGSGDDWTGLSEARLLGWEEAFHDLAVYLESGIALSRIHDWKSAFAVTLYPVTGGLRAGPVRAGGFAQEAGIQPGDLVVRVAGVPVFRRSDQWLLQRMFAPGDEVEVEFVRGGEVLTGRGAMSPLSMW